MGESAQDMPGGRFGPDVQRQPFIPLRVTWVAGMRQTFSSRIDELRRKRWRAVLAHWNSIKLHTSPRNYAMMMGVPLSAIARIGDDDWEPGDAIWEQIEGNLPAGWLEAQRQPVFADLPFHRISQDKNRRMEGEFEFWGSLGSGQGNGGEFFGKLNSANLLDHATVVALSGQKQFVLSHCGAALPIYSAGDPARVPGRLISRGPDTVLCEAFDARYRRVMVQDAPLFQHCEVAVGTSWITCLSLVVPLRNRSGFEGALSVVSIQEVHDLATIAG